MHHRRFLWAQVPGIQIIPMHNVMSKPYWWGSCLLHAVLYGWRLYMYVLFFTHNARIFQNSKIKVFIHLMQIFQTIEKNLWLVTYPTLCGCGLCMCIPKGFSEICPVIFYSILIPKPLGRYSFVLWSEKTKFKIFGYLWWQGNNASQKEQHTNCEKLRHASGLPFSCWNWGFNHNGRNNEEVQILVK